MITMKFLCNICNMSDDLPLSFFTKYFAFAIQLKNYLKRFPRNRKILNKLKK